VNPTSPLASPPAGPGSEPGGVALLRWALPVLLIALAYRASWHHGFLGDAAFLVRDNRFLTEGGHLWANLRHDYFWSSVEGMAIPYWRPGTKLAWLALARVFGSASALPFHLYALAVFALGAVGLQFLARQLGAGRGWACAAAVLYALHPAAVEPVSLIMATSDVVCASAAIWALATGMRWVRGGRWPWALAHGLALVVAFGSKETSVVLPPLLVAWMASAWLLRSESLDRRRALALAGGAGCLLAAYLALRAAALDGMPAPLLEVDPLRIFIGLGVYLRGLIPLRLATGVRSLSFEEARHGLALLLSAATWLALGAGVALALRQRAAGALTLLAWAVASCALVLLPVHMNVPGVEGKIPLADRWMLQAAAATSVLAALGMQRAAAQRHLGAVCWAATAAWALVTVGLAGRTHADYRDDLAFMAREERIYAATPEAFRTVQDRCRHHDRRLVARLVAGDLKGARGAVEAFPPSCVWTRERAVNQLSLLVALGDYGAALPVAEELLARADGDRRADGAVMLLGARVMIAHGRPAEAAALLDRAAATGVDARDLASLHALLARLRARDASG
jgi:hypothetical protein